MKIKNKKNLFSVISVFLLLTIAVSTILMSASAQTAYFNSYIYIAVNSPSVGLNQELIILTWTADIPPYGTGPIQSERGWSNLQIIITDPDGANTTIPIERTDPTGAAYVIFRPPKKPAHTPPKHFSPPKL
ncbi:MAG: hypothetical protein FWE73_03940 [Candidatus Bathyarchaeota archaeon]|nr:hypothetical protein [Candidatus Termitimicrobium sp.]